jgi:hypothetical protein
LRLNVNRCKPHNFCMRYVKKSQYKNLLIFNDVYKILLNRRKIKKREFDFKTSNQLLFL